MDIVITAPLLPTARSAALHQPQPQLPSLQPLALPEQELQMLLAEATKLPVSVTDRQFVQRRAIIVQREVA